MTDSSKWQALPTEAVNPLTKNLDSLSVTDIVGLMILDNERVLDALKEERLHLEQGVDLIAGALNNGGRLIFAGAGTSGRLGVIEAAEMPPTFGTSRDVVQAIMAGGGAAVLRAKEGVEDDENAGGMALGKLRPTKKDVVVGVSASGVTPFVRGALMRARRAHSTILGVTCARESEMKNFVDLLIALDVGPEVIAGSTRLKSGTVTKVVLNILTTAAMVRVGKVYGNLMVDVQGTSAKLRDRGCRIVGAVTGLTSRESAELLRRAKGHVKTAIVMQKAGLSFVRASAQLRAAGGSVRRAIGEA